MNYPKVNAHLHTPYSFSAFRDIDDALDRAAAENVKVVGINDFYTAAGYDEWAAGCEKRKLYPLFNIEFIGLSEKDREAGIRINDPANPGRIYISGKGLAYPFRLPDPYVSLLEEVRNETNRQVKAMCEKLNTILEGEKVGFTLNFERIKKELTKGIVRERHLAKALRMKVYEIFGEDKEGIKAVLEKIFGGRSLRAPVENIAEVENEIRSNLLKAGGRAFVPEDAKAFLPMETICEIVLAAGGIPTYPFLGDDAQGNYTDFEKDLESVAEELAKRGFHSVEFITTRNRVDLLEKYAGYLHDHGFVVTFGSEHNTPVMEPVELFARGRTPLTERLMQINYEGACVVAAHQHVVAQGLEGYVDGKGYADRAKREEWVKLGDELIRSKI